MVTARLFTGVVARNVRTRLFVAFSGRRFTVGFERNLTGQLLQQASLIIAEADKLKDSFTADAGMGRSFAHIPSLNRYTIYAADCH